MARPLRSRFGQGAGSGRAGHCADARDGLRAGAGPAAAADLQRRVGALDVQLGQDFSPLGGPADGGDEVDGVALDDGAAGEHEHVGVSVLADGRGLAGEGRLVDLELVAADQDAVCGEGDGITPSARATPGPRPGGRMTGLRSRAGGRMTGTVGLCCKIGERNKSDLSHLLESWRPCRAGQRRRRRLP